VRTVDLATETSSLAEYARGLHGEPLIVTIKGKPITALLPVEHADLETVSLSLNPRFIDIIERSRARQRAEGGISSEEMRRRLESPQPRAKSRKARNKLGGVARTSSDPPLID